MKDQHFEFLQFFEVQGKVTDVVVRDIEFLKGGTGTGILNRLELAVLQLETSQCLHLLELDRDVSDVEVAQYQSLQKLK
jgi:hypothetical protein